MEQGARAHAGLSLKRAVVRGVVWRGSGRRLSTSSRLEEFVEEGGGCLPRKINQKSWTQGRRVREKGRAGFEERGTGSRAGRRGHGGCAAGEPSLTDAD